MLVDQTPDRSFPLTCSMSRVILFILIFTVRGRGRGGGVGGEGVGGEGVGGG